MLDKCFVMRPEALTTRPQYECTMKVTQIWAGAGVVRLEKLIPTGGEHDQFTCSLGELHSLFQPL